MKKIRVHISGPVSCLTKSERQKYYKFYEEIAKACRQKGWHSFLPHRVIDPALYPELTPREVYETESRDIKKADIVIAYVGQPALGVGTELEIARANNAIAILLYEKDAAVSKIALGNKAVVHEIVFTDFEEALQKLRAALDKIDI